MQTTQMLSVSQLQIGMYVAQLDKPWLDTPFLFQGFYIRDQDEIDELRIHCRNVYVSVESLPSSFGFGDKSVEQRPSTASSKRQLFSLKSVFGKMLGGSNSVAAASGETTTAQALPFGLSYSVVQEADQASETKPKKKKLFGLLSPFTFRKTVDFVEPLAKPAVVYEQTTSLSDEYETAAIVHSKALEVVGEVMESMRTTASLDLEPLKTAVTPMVESMLRNPAALACLVRMQKKHDYLYHHSLACSVWATVLGRQIGLSRNDLQVVALGGMLLDVGMMQVPDSILTKPASLAEGETDLMREHVRNGLESLAQGEKLDKRVLDMVAHHHERYNGTGYPKRLKGNDIPVFGRIAGIVDAYDAMISDRPYAPAMSSYDALRQLRKLADVEFQAEIVEQFTRAIGAFPTGTLVELNTGEVAVVTKQNRIRRLRPEIMVILGSGKKVLKEFKIVDLNEQRVSEEGKHSLWIEQGLPPGSYGIDPSDYYLN